LPELINSRYCFLFLLPASRGKKQIYTLHVYKSEEIQNMINSGEFAEWAMVHGNLYGTHEETEKIE
jgi:guanylate kinase